MTDQYPPGYLDETMHRVPMGQMGDPVDFVAGVVYLASDASRFVTGTTLPVDGGALTT